MTQWLKVLLIAVLVSGAGMLITSELPAEDTEEVEVVGEFDNITINYQSYEKDRQGPVGFHHKKHALDYKVNCWECHHDYDDKGKNTWSPWDSTEKCIECHDPMEKDGKVLMLETAFHANCKVCHRKMDIYKGEVGAYRKCGKCHLDTLKIENTGYKEDKMGPVTFNHRKHEKTFKDMEGQRIACAECHHDYEEGGNVQKCGSPGCHSPLKKRDDVQYRLQNAYHRTCRDCHKAMAKAGKSKTGPYKDCFLCHLSRN